MSDCSRPRCFSHQHLRRAFSLTKLIVLLPLLLSVLFVTSMTINESLALQHRVLDRTGRQSSLRDLGRHLQRDARQADQVVLENREDGSSVRFDSSEGVIAYSSTGVWVVRREWGDGEAGSSEMEWEVSDVTFEVEPITEGGTVVYLISPLPYEAWDRPEVATRWIVGAAVRGRASEAIELVR